MLARVGTRLIDRDQPNGVIQFGLIESLSFTRGRSTSSSRRTHGATTTSWSRWATAPSGRRGGRGPSEILRRTVTDASVRAAHLTTDRVVQHAYHVSEAGSELLYEVRRFPDVAPPELFMVPPNVNLSPEWAMLQKPSGFL